MPYCSECKAYNSPDVLFCVNCKKRLNTELKQSSNKKTTKNIVLRCTLCGSESLSRDIGRLDSQWGLTSFKMVFFTCNNCGHVEMFNKGRSIFDFD